MKKQKKKEINKIEKCVICGSETDYFFNTPVSERRCYVEGVGQLCEKCYCHFFIKKKKDGI